MGANRYIKGVNDLKTWCAQNDKMYLLDEWDYKKNEGIAPSEIIRGSSLYVWWICPLGHSYKAKLYNRTTKDNGCPYCSNHKVLAGFNDLATLNPELVCEWNYEKNKPLKPSDFLFGSSKKVWWKCNQGHEWDAIISTRSKPMGGRDKACGCPYCSNPPKRILVGFNDFESWCRKNHKEQLLQEWNYVRNTECNPQDITYGSGKRVWWKCAKGHEWRVSPSNRIQGTNCPVCARTQTSFPEQALAYYLSKQFRILQRYRSRGYELDILLEDYHIGIEYDGLFFHATADKTVRETKKDAYYQSKGIQLIHIKESNNENRRDGNTIYYRCEKSNYLHSSFDGMFLKLFELLELLTGLHIDIDVNVIRDELKIREHYLAVLEENSVAHCFPELVSEWDNEKNHGMTPDIFAANSHTKVWWKCFKGHNWKAEIASRNRGLGCPYCAGQRLIEGENDLETWCKKYSKHLLKEWDYEKNEIAPSKYTQKSHAKVWWKCNKGHEWKADIANRVNGTNCPKCNTGNNVVRGSVTLVDWCNQVGNDDLLKEWNYKKNNELKPSDVSKGSHMKVWWKCSKGHEWEAQIKSRTYNHGCPYCSGTFKKAQIGINDLVTWCKQNNKQYILEEWDIDSNDELKPEDFTFGSHKRINWKCKNGHTWSAVIKERTKQNGNRCPICRQYE